MSVTATPTLTFTESWSEVYAEGKYLGDVRRRGRAWIARLPGGSTFPVEFLTQHDAGEQLLRSFQNRNAAEHYERELARARALDDWDAALGQGRV